MAANLELGEVGFGLDSVEFERAERWLRREGSASPRKLKVRTTIGKENRVLLGSVPRFSGGSLSVFLAEPDQPKDHPLLSSHLPLRRYSRVSPRRQRVNENRSGRKWLVTGDLWGTTRKTPLSNLSKLNPAPLR